MAVTTKLRPFALGLAFALTIAIMYTVCTVAWVMWQAPALDFLNAFFHGLDFRRLVETGSRFDFRTFLFPLAVLSLWDFITGVLFGVIGNALCIRG